MGIQFFDYPVLEDKEAHTLVGTHLPQDHQVVFFLAVAGVELDDPRYDLAHDREAAYNVTIRLPSFMRKLRALAASSLANRLVNRPYHFWLSCMFSCSPGIAPILSMSLMVVPMFSLPIDEISMAWVPSIWGLKTDCINLRVLARNR